MVSSGPLTAHSGKRRCHSQVSLILLACRADKSLKSSKEILVIFVWRWQGFWGGRESGVQGSHGSAAKTSGDSWGAGKMHLLPRGTVGSMHKKEEP